MSEFHLASLMPSFISTQQLPACCEFRLRSTHCTSFRQCCPRASGHCSRYEIPGKGTAKKCLLPRLVFNLPLQLLFSNISPCTAAQAGGLFSPECPLSSDVRCPPCTTGGPGSRGYLHLTHCHEIKILVALGDHSSAIAHACFLIQ